ncbi:DegV family protein [Clostridium lundense]|uniref:DegV family protein n=1 Tax=Clostridium lundense TaxID=319475 RepID=UPI00048425EB|nr:DegV family protein [Clostridium lundense]
MEKIALITDTAADLHDDVVEKYNIHVLPFRIIYKDREYKDRIDITPKEVYDNLDKEVPTSSLPSMQDMEDTFTKLEEEGYTHAIVVTLSSGLSGIYNAAKLVSENHPTIKTYVCDSQSISAGEGIIIEICAELMEEGKGFDEIVKEIPNIKNRIDVFFVVGTLEYLKRGGRIGKVSGTIGELLNIKPIIGIDKNDGKYYTYDKVRGRKQSINRLLEIVGTKLKEGKYRVRVMNGNASEETNKVFEKIKIMENAVEVKLGGDISPVSGVHSGPGLIGVVLIKEQ